MTNVDVKSEGSRNYLLNHLKSDDFFGVKNFPSSNIAFIDFSDLTFPSVTLTAAGAAIYKTTGGGNELVLVLDFGGNKTATNGDFIIQFPTADASNAIIRLGDA